MDLWKPTVRKAKKQVSGGDPCEWAASLPDVVADLTLADTSPPATHHSSMLGTRDHHYPDMSDVRTRRRNARPPQPPVTPQGLGAGPQGLGAAPTQPIVSGGGATGGTAGGWRHNPQLPWPSQPSLEPLGVATLTSGVGVSGVQGEGEGARVRSASSEPRGPAGNGDRRVRCSSATRSRQHRPRPPPGDRPHGNTTVPPVASLPPSGCGPYSPTPGVLQPGGSAGVVGGVLARLAGCYENLEPGRESGEGMAYGYQVSDLEALLTEASPSRPANLPMVLASSTRLHNMRRTPEPRSHNQQPVRPFLPLGIIVNAVFKTRDWLYVRTAHGAEGYVPYRVCLPLGILPPPREGHSLPLGAVDGGAGGVWDNRVDMLQGGMTQLPVASPAANTTGGMGAEAGGQTRGRSRGRRRPPCIDSSNQTDTQKLQPVVRSLSEARSPRETLETQVTQSTTMPATSNDHVLV
ncbi:uncharacterized protein [Procambarus clarkii]|uniref:uncharacterized protein isoform X1 n=1 Tax=Procambarus clarkii TaxID=6728 RepID=UPI0037448A7B